MCFHALEKPAIEAIAGFSNRESGYCQAGMLGEVSYCMYPLAPTAGLQNSSGILTGYCRFGHTMIPPGIYRRDGQCNFYNTTDSSPALRLCSSWWDAQEEVQ
jgi:hypothetical protein